MSFRFCIYCGHRITADWSRRQGFCAPCGRIFRDHQNKRAREAEEGI